MTIVEEIIFLAKKYLGALIIVDGPKTVFLTLEQMREINAGLKGENFRFSHIDEAGFPYRICFRYI